MAAAGERWRSSEPWEAIAEQWNGAVTLASLGTDAAWAATLTTPPEWFGLQTTEEFGVFAGGKAAEASTYFWRGGLVDVAAQAPLPRHIVSREAMPAESMFWSFEGPFFEIEQTGKQADWCSLWQREDGIAFVFPLSTHVRGQIEIVAGILEYGTRWPEGVHPESRDLVGQMLKMLGLLNSPYTDSDSHRLQRSDRRRLARASVTNADPTVRVVKLRRRTADVESPDSGVQGHPERSHQWWVTGHFRAQWYPSRQAHEVIWIAPHLKGPSDKPILSKVYSVER